MVEADVAGQRLGIPQVDAEQAGAVLKTEAPADPGHGKVDFIESHAEGEITVGVTVSDGVRADVCVAISCNGDRNQQRPDCMCPELYQRPMNLQNGKPIRIK